MNRLSRNALCMALPLTIALPAMAGLPGAIDRAPTDAIAIVSIRNIAELKSDLDKLGNSLPALKDGLSQGPIQMIMGIPGMNTAGSVAAVFVGETLDMQSPQPPMVVIVPVTDAAAFMKGINATKSGELYTADLEGSPTFFKDLSGGYIAMSPREDLITAFDGKPGNLAAHTKRVGKTASSVADTADILMFADMAKLKPLIDEGMAGMKQNMEMVAAMAGPQADQMNQTMAMVESFVTMLTTQGDIGLFATTLTGSGISMDMGAQFKEGTDAFKSMQSKGDSLGILKKLPNIPYLFTFAMDTSSQSMKDMLTGLAKMQGGAAGMLPIDFGTMSKSLDGTAMVLGTSPALMGGGLFANSVLYHHSKDPAALMTLTKDAMGAMNNTSSNGMKINTTYQAGSTTVGGTSVDSWGMRMSVDPNDPNAMAAQQSMQAMMMIYGANMGPSGYLAAGKTGVVQTLSRNTMLLEKSLQVANASDGLGADKVLGSVAEMLPADRTMEAYVGVGEIIKTVGGLMAMFGMPAEFTVPENLAPVGIAMTSNDGAARGRIYIPTAVITAVADIQKQFEGEMGGDMGDDDMDGGGRPRF